MQALQFTDHIKKMCSTPSPSAPWKRRPRRGDGRSVQFVTAKERFIQVTVGGSTTPTTRALSDVPRCEEFLTPPRPVPPDGLLDDAIGLLHNHEQHEILSGRKISKRYALVTIFPLVGGSGRICMSCANALTRRNRAYICKECAEGMEEEG